MDHNLESNQEYYIIKVNGKPVSPRYGSRLIAESERLKLDEPQRSVAEIVPVTEDGKDILFG